MSLTIRAKIMIMMLVGCLAVTCVGVAGLVGMKTNNRGIESLYRESLSNVTRLSQIMALMRDNRIQMLLSLQHDPRNPEIVKLHDHPLSFHTDQIVKNIEKRLFSRICGFPPVQGDSQVYDIMQF